MGNTEVSQYVHIYETAWKQKKRKKKEKRAYLQYKALCIKNVSQWN